jgi:ribosomal protein S18 acetylase RimI-like enzyme
MIGLGIQVRHAEMQDRQMISDLIFYQNHAHRHLDWRSPLDWLGSPHFWLMEENGRALAALACPPDPPGAAWIRLFTFGWGISASEAWNALWSAASAELAQSDGAQAGVIAMQGWMRELMSHSDFSFAHNIVMLEWRGRPALPPSLPAGVILRPLTRDDLPAVEEVDADAFDSMWHISRQNLERAFAQTMVADVIEARGRIVGYQLSTGKSGGAHLARLAVRKEAQGFGFGSALVANLILQLRRRGAELISVNTQHDNRASLTLYRKFGFERTGEEYPVYLLSV